MAVLGPITPRKTNGEIETVPRRRLRTAAAICKPGGSSHGRGARGLLAVFFFLVLGLNVVRAEISREYQLKAVFLYNFAQFTEWPTNTFAGTNAPFVIGVLGADPFGPVLDDTVRGESAHGRRIVIERYRTVQEVKTCHILFISQSEARHLAGIMAALKNKPVLTVSDIEGAALQGVMIRFMTENNRLRLRVNLRSVKDADLTLSSKLLRVADVVAREDEQ